MLILRNEQLQKFIAEDDEQLARVVAGAVRAANGERVAGYDDAELNTMVRIGIDRAKSHGLAAAEDIAAFVAVMFEVAPRFDEQPDIQKALDESLLPAHMKMDLFADSVTPDAWAEAERRYDDSFWFPESAAS